jgi:hypothetical protein
MNYSKSSIILKTSIMKRSIVTFFLVVMLFGNSYGDDYPISPRPLRMLIEESTYIITGRVTEIKQVSRKEGKSMYSDHYAVILLHDVLKGEIIEKEIQVIYEPRMVCPAPPFYLAGTTVVVFLDKHGDNYATHALSYGAKTVSDSTRDIYTSRIREMQEINKMKGGLDKFMATVEWLVKCAEHRDTRWEGTYELSPESDFMSSYSRVEHIPFSSMLSHEQRARLKHALFAEKEKGFVDLGLVDLVYVGNEKEVHLYLLDALKNISGSGYYFAKSLMERLKLLTNEPELDDLIKKYEAVCWDMAKDNDKKKKEIIFVSLLEK